MKSDPERSYQHLLSLSDRDRRRMAGRAVQKYLQEKGLDGIAFVSNLVETLSPSAQQAVIHHAVPLSAYSGRMMGMALGMLPHPGEKISVVMEESIVRPELDFWQQFTERNGIAMPIVLPERKYINRSDFVYPYIGSRTMNSDYPGRTLPEAEGFNRKANMRQLLREIGEDDNLVPGTEVRFAGDEDLYYKRVEEIAKGRATRTSKTQWIKHTFAASGLTTFRFSPDHSKEDGYFQKSLRAMFQSPDNPQKTYPDDVVIEESIDFGASPTSYGDFSLRGMVAPDGLFIPFSIGRVISDPNGEYLGMVMVQGDKNSQLDNIGLHPLTYAKSVDIFARVVAKIHAQGYTFGPASIDFFCQQNNPASPVLNHDFNIREGGTSIGGLITSFSDGIWPGNHTVLDIELKVVSEYRLGEDDLDVLTRFLWDTESIPYGTTFLRYPKLFNHHNPDSCLYTVKVLSPYASRALTDGEVIDSIRILIDKFNTKNRIKGVSFQSPV